MHRTTNPAATTGSKSRTIVMGRPPTSLSTSRSPSAGTSAAQVAAYSAAVAHR